MNKIGRSSKKKTEIIISGFKKKCRSVISSIGGVKSASGASLPGSIGGPIMKTVLDLNARWLDDVSGECDLFDFLVEDGDEVRVFIEKRELVKGNVVVTTG